MLDVPKYYILLLLSLIIWVVPHMCWIWPVVIILLYYARHKYQSENQEDDTLHINWMINTAWINMAIIAACALFVTLLCWNSSVDMEQVSSMEELLAIPGSIALLLTVVLLGVIAPVWPLYRAWHGMFALRNSTDPREYTSNQRYSIILATICQVIALTILYFE